MQKFGLDFSTVSARHGGITRVQGRTLHIDGDFISYHSTLPNRDGVYSEIDEQAEQFLIQCDTMRELAGCSRMKIHLTHPESTKGGRYTCAIQQPYQENRKEPSEEQAEHKVMVHAIRFAIADLYSEWTSYHDVEVKACMSADFEADDTLSWALNKNPNDVLWSGDKDLTMVSGWHLVDKEWTLKRVEGFGNVRLDTSTSTTKVKGYGTCFFWHQMLMGDTADNIKGLLQIETELINEFFPTKASIEGQRRQESGERLTKAQREALCRRAQPCGPIKAFTLLGECESDYECLRRVVRCYKACYQDDWQRIFYSEGQMLWMTRSPTDTIQQFISEVLKCNTSTA